MHAMGASTLPPIRSLPINLPSHFPTPRRQNCEMRTVVLSDGGGAGVPDRTWFP